MNALRRGKFALFVLALAAGASHAAQLYKSIGPDGRVTYSDRPPAGAARVEVIPVEPAGPRVDRAPNSAPSASTATPQVQPDYEQIIRRRKVVDDSEVKAAERALAAARAALQEAQENSTPEDWQYFGGRWGRGGRFPKPEYAARLEALEQGVKQAEGALTEAQRRFRLAS
jgi:hypothetical protein